MPLANPLSGAEISDSGAAIGPAHRVRRTASESIPGPPPERLQPFQKERISLPHPGGRQVASISIGTTMTLSVAVAGLQFAPGPDPALPG